MSEQVSYKSELRKRHRDEQGPAPDDEHDSEWIPYIPWLEARLSKMEREQFVVWEGEESEGQWRCLMCGDTRNAEDDTGPEGVQHIYNCGEVGATVWAFDRMFALEARPSKMEEALDKAREAIRELAHGKHSGRGYANQVIGEIGEALAGAAEEEA